MVDRWIVFGGWATPPWVLAPLFGRQAELIDLSGLMPMLVKNGVLRPDWETLVAGYTSELAGNRPFGCAGWSTGSHLAYAAAKRLYPRATVLLAATPSFCRKPGFPFGQKNSILRAMRERFAVDPTDVLTKFYAQCGIPARNDFIDNDKKNPVLVDGLHFLEQANVLPVTPLSCPSLFLHGRSDRIVPFQAGMRFAEDAGGRFAGYAGGHAFFIGREGVVAEEIREFGRIRE